MLHVMRLGPGDRIMLCNNEVRTVIAQLEQISKEQVVCRIVEEVKISRELPVTGDHRPGLAQGR